MQDLAKFSRLRNGLRLDDLVGAAWPISQHGGATSPPSNLSVRNRIRPRYPIPPKVTGSDAWRRPDRSLRTTRVLVECPVASRLSPDDSTLLRRGEICPHTQF